jgi:outer membrane protein TolC
MIMRATVVLLLGLTAATARAEVVTLAALERVALQERSLLAADAARARAARADVDRAKSSYHPSFELQAQSSLSPGRKLITVEDVEGDSYLVQGARGLDDSGAFEPQLRNDLSLEVRANLYDFGRTSSAVAATRAREAAAEADADRTRDVIVRAVRTAYLGWLAASELQQLAAQSAAEAKARQMRVEALIAEGARPAADSSPARADALLVELELERAFGDLRSARLLLEQAVGKPLAETAEPDHTMLDFAMNAPETTRSASLRVLERQHEAAHKQARAHDKSDAPVLAGSATGGLRVQGETPFPAYGVGLSFTLPLWDGGASSASARAARARADELSALIREREESERNERQRAQLEAQNAQARLEAAQALLEVCSQRLQEAEQSYELGAGGIEALGQARSMLRRATTEVVLAKLARARARLGLSP